MLWDILRFCGLASEPVAVSEDELPYDDYDLDRLADDGNPHCGDD